MAEKYKVQRLIDDLLPHAVRPTRAGIRISLDIYLREGVDGDWAEVVFLDPNTRKQLNRPDNTMPLSDPSHVSTWVGWMVEKALPLMRSRRTG